MSANKNSAVPSPNESELTNKDAGSMSYNEFRDEMGGELAAINARSKRAMSEADTNEPPLKKSASDDTERLRNANTQLVNECSRLRDHIAKLDAAHRYEKAMAKTYKDARDEANLRAEAARSECETSLQAQKARHAEQVEELSSRIKQLELQVQDNSSKTNLADTTASYESKRREQAELAATNTRTRAKNAEENERVMRTSMVWLNDSLARFKDDIKVLESEKKALEEANSALTKRIDEVSDELAKEVEDHNETDLMHDDTYNKAKSMKARIQELEQEKEQLAAEFRDYKEAVDVPFSGGELEPELEPMNEDELAALGL